MLKNLAQITAICVFVIVTCFLGLMLYRSLFVTEQQENADGNPAATNSEQQGCKKQGCGAGVTPSVTDASDKAVADYTKWLAIFTALLVLVSGFQIGFLISADRTATKAANAAKDAAETAKTSLTTVQRAFVFIDVFEANVLNNELVIMPKWRNSGSTPTRFMTNHVNWTAFVGRPPVGYQYPDFDAHGTPITDATRNNPPTFVGPNATAFADQLIIPTNTMDAVRNGQLRLFVWGWARYQDVFHALHITRFCNEVRFTQIGAVHSAVHNTPAGAPVAVALSFSLYGEYNCTDEECTQQGIP
jgi:hypothetical protein